MSMLILVRKDSDSTDGRKFAAAGLECWEPRPGKTLTQLIDVDPADLLVVPNVTGADAYKQIVEEFERTGRSAQRVTSGSVGWLASTDETFVVNELGSLPDSPQQAVEDMIRAEAEAGAVGKTYVYVESMTLKEKAEEGRLDPKTTKDQYVVERLLRYGYVLKVDSHRFDHTTHKTYDQKNTGFLFRWVYDPPEAAKRLARLENARTRIELELPKLAEKKRLEEEARKKAEREAREKAEAEDKIHKAAQPAIFNLARALFDKIDQVAPSYSRPHEDRLSHYGVVAATRKLAAVLPVFQSFHGEERLIELPDYRIFIWTAAREWANWRAKYTDRSPGRETIHQSFFDWTYAHLRLPQNRRIIRAKTRDEAAKFPVPVRPWKPLGLGFEVADDDAPTALPADFLKSVGLQPRKKRAPKPKASPPKPTPTSVILDATPTTKKFRKKSHSQAQKASV